MLRIASFNVENLFERPRAFNEPISPGGNKKLEAFRRLNELMMADTYSDADKQQMLKDLVALDVYTRGPDGTGAARRNRYPTWAWLRKNRGEFDRQPKDKTKDVEIVAKGRADWLGWVELVKEQVNEVSTRMTARVIRDVRPNVLAIIEAEDRPSLVRFNRRLIRSRFKHVMLVDGNDDRGIDVGIMTTARYPIETIRSNVDATDGTGQIFSRDCPEYEVRVREDLSLFVLVNHFKSQSGGGGGKRKRQAVEVRRIADRLVNEGKHVIVLGDLNEGPVGTATPAANLATLFGHYKGKPSPLVDCFSLPGFDKGGKEGTYDSCGIKNRLDYILISDSLRTAFRGGGVWRKGLWGDRKTRPTDWEVYKTISTGREQASDHGAVYVDLEV